MKKDDDDVQATTASTPTTQSTPPTPATPTKKRRTKKKYPVQSGKLRKSEVATLRMLARFLHQIADQIAALAGRPPRKH